MWRKVEWEGKEWREVYVSNGKELFLPCDVCYLW
jgi:hypothetical protein